MRVKYLIVLIMVAVFAVPVSAGIIASIDRINYISNDPNFQGEAWSVDFLTTPGGTDSLFASVSKDKITTIDGLKAANGFTVSTDSLENSCEYNILTSSDPVIHTIDIDHRRCWFYEEGGASACIQRWVNSIDIVGQKACRDGGGFYQDCWAAVKSSSSLGTPGTISGKFNGWKTNFEVNVPGKGTESITLSNSAGPTGGEIDVGSRTKVLWKGNLQSGRTCEDPDNVAAAHSNSFGGWIIIDKNNYLDYRREILSELSTDMSLCVSLNEGDNRCDSVKNNFNRVANSAIVQDTTDAFVKQGNFQITNNDINNGKIKATFSEGLVSYPNFQLILSGDISWLGVIKPVGEPEIVSASSVKFTEGGRGIIEAVVRNRGSGRGSFEVFVQCSEGFNSNDRKFLTLDGRESKGVNIGITGASSSADRTVAGTCNLIMRETGSNEQASRTVQVSFDQIFDCTPNEKKCSADFSAITQCNSQGTGIEIIEVCSANELCEQDAEPFCRTVDTGKCGNKGQPPVNGECCGGLKEEAGICIEENETPFEFAIIEWALLVIAVTFMVIAVYFKRFRK